MELPDRDADSTSPASSSSSSSSSSIIECSSRSYGPTGGFKLIDGTKQSYKVPHSEKDRGMFGSGSFMMGGEGPYMEGGAGKPNKLYHCRMCEQEFPNKSDMQRHAKEVHRMEEKSHKCCKCFKSFPSSQQLAQHSLVHSNVRKYPCRFCDKMFKQLSHVQQHLRIHTGERPYRCTVNTCMKSFRQLSSLQQHLKGHNVPLPKSYPISKSASSSSLFSFPLQKMLARPHDLICQVCEKHCEDEVSFFRHLQQLHPDYWKVFSSDNTMMEMKGMKQEMDEDVHTCIVCKEEFLEEDQYWKHMRHIHPDISPIPTNTSPNNNNNNNTTTTPNIKTNLKDLPLYTCSVCQKLFTQETYLLKHIEHKTDIQHQETYKRIMKNVQQQNERRMPDKMVDMGLKNFSEGHSSKGMKEKEYFRDDPFRTSHRDSCLKYMDAFPDVTQQQQQQQQQMRFGMNSYNTGGSSGDDVKPNNGWSREMFSDHFSGDKQCFDGVVGKHSPHIKSKYDQDIRSNNNNNTNSSSSSGNTLQLNKSLSSSSSFSSSSSLMDKNEMDDMSTDDFNQSQSSYFRRAQKSMSNMIGHSNAGHTNLSQGYMSSTNQQPAPDFIDRSPVQSNDSCNSIIMNNSATNTNNNNMNTSTNNNNNNNTINNNNIVKMSDDASG